MARTRPVATSAIPSSSCGCAATSTPRLRSEPRRWRRSARPGRASGWSGRCSTSARCRPTAGDHSAARSLLSESLAVAEEIGYREGIAWSFNLLGVVSCRVGDHEAAEELLRDSLELHRALGDQWRTASVLDGLAACAAARSEAVRAARLLGAAAAIRSRIGVPIPTCEQPDHDRTVAMVRDELGVDGMESAQLAGSAIPLDRLVAPRGWGTIPAVRTGRRPPVVSR